MVGPLGHLGRGRGRGRRRGVTGMVGWRQYDASQRAEASAAYSAALAQIAQDKPRPR